MTPIEFATAYLPLARELVQITPGIQFQEPLAGATEQEISSAESRLGVIFDEQHRGFLLYANGWPGFSGTLSMLGTEDYSGSQLLRLARRNIQGISGSALGRFRWLRSKLIPVAASDCTLDVLCMVHKAGRSLPSVIWLNNSEPEEFVDFNDYLTKTLSYMPELLEYAKNRDGRTGAGRLDS